MRSELAAVTIETEPMGFFISRSPVKIPAKSPPGVTGLGPFAAAQIDSVG
jgi:hypothetical protein